MTHSIPGLNLCSRMFPRPPPPPSQGLAKEKMHIVLETSLLLSSNPLHSCFPLEVSGNRFENWFKVTEYKEFLNSFIFFKMSVRNAFGKLSNLRGCVGKYLGFSKILENWVA